MPIRDDFILRMLDSVAEVMARVLTGSGGAGLAEAERELADAYMQLTGSGRALVARLSSEQLLAILGAPMRFNRERGYVLARLLEADAGLTEAEAGGDASPSGAAAEGAADTRRLKALDLYLEAAKAGLDEEDLEARIGGLVAALSGLALPESSYWRVFEHAAGGGRFAEAEDLLFDALARFGAGADVAERGRAFYRDLEALPDEALEAGALPRDEVVEGRAAFEAELRGADGAAAGGSSA
jgi:hypothetical protein